MISKKNRQMWLNRKRRIRKKVSGTSERPRLTVFRSAKQIYAQVIDDEQGKTLVSASSVEKDIRDKVKGEKNGVVAEKVGQLLAERCQTAKIDKVVFDRNGYFYIGRIAKLADAARKKGLKF
ncbi:MAG: 50S ribosomal protein L18 [Deltaproteobacteria bacterium]|nr:50S ribosomal protein L18 [Deltaproteobacteria bacterium]